MSPGTADFNVGTTELLSNSSCHVLLPLLISPNLWTTTFPLPNSFRFLATFLPYSIGLLNGCVKLCETNIAWTPFSIPFLKGIKSTSSLMSLILSTPLFEAPSISIGSPLPLFIALAKALAVVVFPSPEGPQKR